MVTSVAVAGASGYAGGELLRMLSAVPAFQIVAVSAATNAGQTVGQVHPNLVGRAELAQLTLVETTDLPLADVDLLFLALPHGQSARVVADLAPAGPCVVDLGADFRLERSADWQAYYAGPHAGTWTYGLPELPGARSAIAQSRLVANPGCYATAVIVSLEPLLAHGLVEPEDIVVTASSGTSGAGRAPTGNLLASEVMGSMSAYKVGGIHQHTPEIEQALRTAGNAPVRLSFTPFLAPMPRGIISSASARVRPGVTLERLRSALLDRYAAEAFVHVLDEGSWPRTSDVLGGNGVHLQVAFDAHAGRAVVICVLDNLVKGAAGQAIQNANLMLGLPEETGLSVTGVAP